MKLNDKGLKRLLDVAFDGDEFYQSNALEVEFEPSDFKGMVCLSIEEAKNTVEIINSLCEFVNINTDFVSDLFLDGCSAMKILDARIKQAEKKDE